MISATVTSMNIQPFPQAPATTLTKVMLVKWEALVEDLAVLGSHRANAKMSWTSKLRNLLESQDLLSIHELRAPKKMLVLPLEVNVASN